MKRFYLLEAFKRPANHTIPKVEELKNDTQHPELNSKTYGHEVVKIAPPQDYLKFYSYICQNIDGLFLLATNEYTTNIFNGVFGASYDFNDYVGNNSKKNTEFLTTLAENIFGLYFLHKSSFIIPTSSNTIELYNITSSAKLENESNRGHLCILKVAKQTTDGGVNCLDVFHDRNSFIVGTKRGHIECYEYNSKELFQSYNLPFGHYNEITGISTHPSMDLLWTSTSSDKSCLIWDRRLVYPATPLILDHHDILSDVHWYSKDIIIASDSIGNVMSFDIRNSKNPLCKKKASNRSITSLNFHDNKFGIISESCNAFIYSVDEKNELKFLHEHNAHPFMLNSLCWDVHSKSNTYYVVGDEKYGKEVTINQE